MIRSYIANVAGSSSFYIAEGAGTIQHETQHLKIDVAYLKAKQKLPTAKVQHLAMKIKTGSLYKQRYNMYKSLKPLWVKTYEKWKNDYKSENDFIHRRITDFRD